MSCIRAAPGAVRFPATRAGSLGQLDAAFAEAAVSGARHRLVWSGATALSDRGRALAGAPAAGPVPGGLRATLRPYQEDGLRWLQHLRAHGAGGVLADDMGLGKTLQTIAHLVAEKEAGRLDAPALIVAPTSVVGNWRRELGRFAPHLRVRLVRGAGRRFQWAQAGHCDVVLTTYPLLARDEALLASRRFSALILDEAQAIKNPRSQAHRAAARINAATGSACPARRWRTTSVSCGRCSTSSTRACSATPTGSATASRCRSSATRTGSACRRCARRSPRTSSAATRRRSRAICPPRRRSSGPSSSAARSAISTRACASRRTPRCAR